MYAPLHAGIHLLPVNRITDRCKNITLPQTYLRAVEMKLRKLNNQWIRSTKVSVVFGYAGIVRGNRPDFSHVIPA